VSGGSVSKAHIPVLVKETIEGLIDGGGTRYIDCTVGTGGHTHALLSSTGDEVAVIGIDKDKESLLVAERRLKEYGDRVTLIQGGFEDLDTLIEPLNPGPISGILFDLGMSSFQLEDAERGFSFKEEGPLDMRFDCSQELTAERIINNSTKEQLFSLLKEYGEDRWSRRLSRVAVDHIAKEPFQRTTDLSLFIRRNIPRKAAHKTLARVFQALRIAVNNELENLKTGLVKAFNLLDKGGRIAIISYHSLEDRIAKTFFRTLNQAEVLSVVNPRCRRPSKEERLKNRRSRSARLRVVVKTGELPGMAKPMFFEALDIDDEEGWDKDD
jgi:16S rRNA (cytosine1402-N4)-methyltransferase